MANKLTLDEKIAKALTDEAVTVESLDELIEQAEKAMVQTKEAADVAHARAVDPRVVDQSAFAIATENEHYHQRYKNARQQLIAKRNKIEVAAAHAAWTAQADQVEAKAEAVSKEFGDTYQAAVATLVALFARVQAVNNAVKTVNHSSPISSRRVKELKLAAAIMQNIKLPDSNGVDQYAWPLPVQPLRVDLATPVYNSRLYSADWAAAKQEQEEAFLKQKREEQQRQEAKAAEAYRGPKWWAGERLPPERGG